MKTGPPSVNTSSATTPEPNTTPVNSPPPSTPVVNTNASAQPVSPEQLQQEQHLASNGNTDEKETFKEKMSRMSKNCWESTGLCCFKAKEQSQIAALEFQIVQRQKTFGVDYLTMVLANEQQVLNGTSPPEAPIAEALDRCVQEAVSEIHSLQEQIDSRMVNIDQRTVEVQSRIQPAPGTPASSAPQPTTAAAVLIDEGVEATPETPASTAPTNTPPAAAFASASAPPTSEAPAKATSADNNVSAPSETTTKESEKPTSTS